MFYFFLFASFTLGAIIPFYLFFIFLAFLPISEKLWRWVTGIRPLRIKAEKERLIPLFEEVYKAYSKGKKSRHTKNIKLYIQESMSINAFAFGRETLVLTKGSIDMLSDEELKGIMAHELAHFHNYDAIGALFAYVANLPMTLLMKKLRQINSRLDDGIVKFFFNAIFLFFRLIEFAGDIIVMYHSRRREYGADSLALKWGYGEELAGALIHMYQISMEKPKSIGEMVRSTHPPITKRIEALEDILYFDIGMYLADVPVSKEIHL